MNRKDTDFIIENITYIRSKVDQINGRVRANEQSISMIKGVITGVIFVFTAIGSLFGYIIKG